MRLVGRFSFYSFQHRDRKENKKKQQLQTSLQAHVQGEGRRGVGENI